MEPRRGDYLWDAPVGASSGGLRRAATQFSSPHPMRRWEIGTSVPPVVLARRAAFSISAQQQVGGRSHLPRYAGWQGAQAPGGRQASRRLRASGRGLGKRPSAVSARHHADGPSTGCQALELAGEPFPVAEQVGSYLSHGFFSVSANGVLAYRSGSSLAVTPNNCMVRSRRQVSGNPGPAR